MMPALPSVRRVSQADADWVRDELERAWGSVYAARKGQVIDASALDGFVASLDRVDVGLIMVRQHGLEYEVVSISTRRSKLTVSGAHCCLGPSKMPTAADVDESG